MKASDQMKQVQRGFETSNHTFFARVARAVADKIKTDSGLEVVLTGKTAGDGKISAVLIGQTADPEQISDVAERVRRTMQDLKNPTTLTDLLK